jgi:hypothetical protein
MSIRGGRARANGVIEVSFSAMLGTSTQTMRTVAVATLLALGAAACSGSTPRHAPTTTPGARLDDRIEGPTATAAAGASHFNGEILDLYIAPSADDWPQALRDERQRTIQDGCVNEPTGQSELDFMQPLTLPPGFEPAGYLQSTGKPEVVACGGRATGLNFEYRKTNKDGTPATVTLSRSVARAETFDAAASDVRASTIGARQAVVIARAASDAPAQRSMVLFREDFGATIIYAFNLPQDDLLAFASSVAEASAPYWEQNPAGFRADRIARTCAEIPAEATSDHAALELTSDDRSLRAIYSYIDASSNRAFALVLYAGDALDGCPEQIKASLAFGRDSALFDEARTWLATQRGELAGECATRPLISGRDPALAAWCYYRPRRQGTDIVLSVGRPQTDYVVDLVMRPLDGGRYDLRDVATPALDNMRLWYFQDERAFRWTTYDGAAAYRLKGHLVAVREHAPDPCAAPPLAEETRAITLDETVRPEAQWYFLDGRSKSGARPSGLPELPPEDAWYVAIDGANGEGTVGIEALGPNGEVIAATSTNWVRDLICVKPHR